MIFKVLKSFDYVTMISPHEIFKLLELRAIFGLKYGLHYSPVNYRS